MILRGEGFEIRPLTACKLDAAVQVYRQSTGENPLTSRQITGQTVLEEMSQSRQAGGIYYGIFDQQDELVGTLDFIPANYAGRPEDACICTLKIAAPFRGRGYASRVIKHLEEELRKDGQIRRLWACFVEGCPTRREFAIRLGFRPVDEATAQCPESFSGDALVKNLV